MKARTDVRVIPDTPRYFAVDLGEKHGKFHFRFPTYGKAARMTNLLQGFEKGDGIERLVELLDVAGYAIGLCWRHRAYDLEAGEPPAMDSDDWREYGDDVIDELQEYGLGLSDLMKIVVAIINELAARLSEMGEAEAVAGNS